MEETAPPPRANDVEFLVSKRCNNLAYIKKLHDEKNQVPVLWLDIVRVTPQDIINYYDPSALAKRTEQWFYLGYSLAPLLNLPNGQQYVGALLQLMEEYEHHFINSQNILPGMKILKVKGPQQADSIKPVITRSGGKAVFDHLQLPNIPCTLDYRQVVFSLCELFTLIYRKLFDYTSSAPQLYDAIIKFDGRVKHHVIGLISKDLNNLAMSLIKKEFMSLHTLFSGNNDTALWPDMNPDTEASGSPAGIGGSEYGGSSLQSSAPVMGRLATVSVAGSLGSVVVPNAPQVSIRASGKFTALHDV